MSTALINRSLTTIRTELEFLLDSEVITQGLYEKLVNAIPAKHLKDSTVWDTDKLGLETAPKTAVDSITTSLADTKIAPPAGPPLTVSSLRPVGYCRVEYDYASQESGDLALQKDDKVAVVEHLSEDWWKGYKKADGPSKTGVFPSNYVKVISEQEFENNVRHAAPSPSNEKASYEPEKATYSSGNGSYNQQYLPQPPQYNSPQYPQQQLQQQPSYGGYAQYPPPSTNYYTPQQQQQPQVQVAEQPHEQSAFRKFGGKLGNAAIFGAGATLGGDLVNSIF